MLIITPSSLALQQTPGDLNLNISNPTSSYIIKNDKDISVDVSLTSDIDNYIGYPVQLSLNPQEFKNVSIWIKNTPTKDISGIIYATEKTETSLTSGASVNVKLGKHVYIAGAPSNIGFVSIYNIIIIILLIMLFGLYHIYHHNKNEDDKGGEYEN